MSQNILAQQCSLAQQRNLAAEAVGQCLETLERVENALRSKQGNASVSKRAIAVIIPLVLMAATAAAVCFGWNIPWEVGTDSGRIALMTAGVTAGFYLLLQIVKLKMNDAYYKAVFRGLGNMDRIRKSLIQYRNNMEARFQEMMNRQNSNWMLPMAQGPDYMKQIEAIDKEISNLEQTKSKGLENVITVSCYAASFSVALAELLALQMPVSSLIDEMLAYGDNIYLVCMIISVIGGPLVGTYFFHRCCGYEFGTASFLWIALDGLAGLAVCMLVLLLVAIAIGVVMFVVQLVITIAGVLFALFILISILGGA